MNCKHFSLLIFFLGLASVQAAEPGGSAPRPNILLILADDLGWSDLGSYGGEIRTPNLDGLAANGLRFTQAYNSSRCCPSRASLLTGLYPHQAGIGHFVGNGRLPGYLGRLSDRCVTLSEVLSDAGYNTYAVGKWHVNEPGPIERGFNEFYGFVHGYGVDSWNPRMMIRLPEGRSQRAYAEGEFFATDALTDHAFDFLELARREEQPWMLYVAYQVAHFPVQAPPELTATYTNIYQRGWDALRAERLERMQSMGLIDDDIPLPPRAPIDRVDVARRLGSMTDDGHNPAWNSLSEERRADLAQRMSVYAAMVENMDTNIGRLLASLRANGEMDNTLVLFLSDNGACAEWEPFGFDLDPDDYRNQPRGHGINGGTPGKPNILHTGADLAAMGGPGSLFSYGCAWANLSNTPLSYYKHYAHEGGIRTPLIAHWPSGISDRGELRQQVVHIMDIMATCVEVAGGQYPSTFQGRDIQPTEGRSLVPAFEGKPAEPRTLVFEHERNAALRNGDWKLVAHNVVRRERFKDDPGWELYNLAEDPVEQNDLAAKHPEIVARMAELLFEEAQRIQVFPSP